MLHLVINGAYFQELFHENTEILQMLKVIVSVFNVIDILLYGYVRSFSFYSKPVDQCTDFNW